MHRCTAAAAAAAPPPPRAVGADGVAEVAKQFLGAIGEDSVVEVVQGVVPGKARALGWSPSHVLTSTAS